MTNLQITSIQNSNITNRTASTPNFCGTKTNPIQQDTVEISGKKKNKNTVTTLILCGLGIAGAIFAWVKFHKTTSVKAVSEELSPELKEIQQIYKDIFRRDITAEETKDFAQRYKKIIDSKTPDNDREYCEKLLNEICKDRKTKKPKIDRWKNNVAEANLECKDGGMATMPDGMSIDVYIYNYYNNPEIPIPEKGMFESLFHESHHVKQDEIIYRTDKEFFLQNCIDQFVCGGEGKMYKVMLDRNGGNEQKTLNEIRQLMSAQLERHWGSFEPLAEGSAEYQEGLRLIEGKKNYKPFWECAEGEYEEQIIEKGAYADGRKAERLFDILKSLTI